MSPASSEPPNFISASIRSQSPRGTASLADRRFDLASPHNTKGSLHSDPPEDRPTLGLQGRFDFETPSFKQGLRNVLGILVPPRPFPQPGRAEILVGGKFVLVHHLLEFGNGGSHGPDWFGLAPVRVSTSLSHENSIL